MKYNPAIHNRKSIRLKGYDYSRAGLYFITFCVHTSECLFGTIKNGEMILNDAGRMIRSEWKKLPQRFTNIELHEFVVMPNHFHGIAEIVTPVGAPLVGAQDPGAHNDGNNNAMHADDGTPTNVRAPLVGAQNPGAYNDGNNNAIHPDDGTSTNVRAPLVGAQNTGAYDDGNNNAMHADDGTPTNVRAPLVGAQTTSTHDDGNNNAIHPDDGTSTNVRAPLVGAQNTGAYDDGNNNAMHAGDGTPINERAPTRGAPTNADAPTDGAANTIGEMMGSFKSITTVEYIKGVNEFDWKPFAGKLWQRNFYEHIIRNETAYYKISDYIFNNPIRWKEDKFYKR